MPLSSDNRSALQSLFINISSVGFVLNETRRNQHDWPTTITFRVLVCRVSQDCFSIDIQTDCPTISKRRHDWDEDFVDLTDCRELTVEVCEGKSLRHLVYHALVHASAVEELCVMVESGFAEISFYHRGLEDVRPYLPAATDLYPSPKMVLEWLMTPSVHV